MKTVAETINTSFNGEVIQDLHVVIASHCDLNFSHYFTCDAHRKVKRWLRLQSSHGREARK